MPYIGQVMHDKYPRGRKGGTFSVSSSSLAFDTGEEVYSIPLEGITIEMGGSGNRLIYFTSSVLPEHSFYCSDRAILKEPSLQNNRQLAGFLATIKKKYRINAMLLLGVIAGLITLTLLLFLSYDALISAVVQKFPYSWEEKVGKKLYSLVTLDTKKLDDATLTAELHKIIDPIIDVVDEDMQFSFMVAENSEANAFALPGGNIVIYTGLLQQATSAEEVAGVIAHEIAHVTCRHHMRGLLKKAGLVLAVQMALGDVSALAVVIAEYGTTLANLSYSRSFENEADQIGWSYLEKAQIDPQGMIRFFEGLMKGRNERVRDLENSLTIFSTHPALEKRITMLRGYPVTGEYHHINIDYILFKDYLLRLLGTKEQETAYRDRGVKNH
ncbi:MAG: hypothetical protein D3923_06175 [Candidatus Electrothrix sp. AR3]|nr:hypothetical protein [Candidatus Electrothrix sp. AR3]